MAEKRVLLGAKYSVIEPLGLLHLSAVAKEEGWEPRICLVKDNDFREFEGFCRGARPDLVGFTVYTGNHIPIFRFLDDLRKKSPHLQTVLGGPHATYFPKDSSRHADFVVLSEGLNGFRRILRGEAPKGIVALLEKERYPISDREAFYLDNPEHQRSRIKSLTTSFGCPFSCTYCYNSSKLCDIRQDLDDGQANAMERSLGKGGRLFPRFQRPVGDVIEEARQIVKISPGTRMIYFQDDVFGGDVDWMREFKNKWDIGLPFHAQMRFENANPESDKNKEKLMLMREAGCTGLTLAIESADPIIRGEVLNRNTPQDLMFSSLAFLAGLGLRVRTEQMLGLPYGATSRPTKVGIESDLEILDLNIRLREETGLPTMAWASTFAPYMGTKIGAYCREHGFYLGGNDDIPDTFFERSVLRFPAEWVGPSLSPDKEELWMSHSELETHRDKLQVLRHLFNYYALLPKGTKLARRFLDQDPEALREQSESFRELSTITRRHLYDSVLYDVEDN